MKRWLFVTIGAIISLGYVGSAEADKTFLKALQDTLAKLGNPWVAGETELSNLPIEEKRKMCGFIPFSEEVFEVKMEPRPPLKDPPPTTMDWRAYNGKNWMTPVKNQTYACGSCWAFGWISTQEARMNIWKGDADWNQDLSEQFVISCNSQGYGCDGGNYSIGSWVKSTGIPNESCYPYRAKDRNNGAPCSDKCPDWETRAELGKITKWGFIPKDISTDTLKEEIMRGPVAMSINVKEDFFYYKEGVYEPIMGEKQAHGISVCGWNSSNNWLCKNSYGSTNPYFWHSGGWFEVGAWMDPAVADTGIPIILATDSLKFVFGEKGLNSTSTSPSDEIILEPTLPEGYKVDEDTIKYDDGSVVRWWRGIDYYGVKFTPPEKCNLIAGLIMRLTDQVENDKLIVRADTSGSPGTTMEEVSYTTQAGGQDWYRQDLSTSYEVDSDFWLTYQLKTGTSPASKIGGDGAGGSRSYVSLDYGSTWENIIPYAPSDLLIRAIITYGGGYDALGTIWVKNIGGGKLEVSDIHAQGNSSWIVLIDPKSFDVFKNDSAGIEVGVDTSGLQADVLHQDEIVITSNSGKTETRVPVTLLIKSGGVTEEEVSTLAMFKLSPNPFRDKVSISYFVPKKTNVKLVVCDIAGREVARIVDKLETTGIKKIEWDTKDIPSGVYFCRFTVGNFESTKKVLLVR